MRNQQTSLFEKEQKKRYSRTVHGGAATKGKRKLERPLSTKKPIHMVLKSEKAVGKLSFLGYKNKTMVERILNEKGQRLGVRIADMANVAEAAHSREARDKFTEEFKRWFNARREAPA